MQPSQMADFLRRGMGRVVLFLRQQTNQTKPYRDVILQACLHDTRYDKQCEARRAPYLFDVLQATGEPAWFAARLVEVLQTSAAQEESDEEQRAELAGLFAEDGNTDARRALYVAFERSVRAGSPVGTDAIIALDGALGFQVVAQMYHDFPSPDKSLWWHIGDLAEKLGGPDAVQQAFDQMEADAPALAPYLREGRQEWEDVQSGVTYKKAEQKRQKRNALPNYEGIQAALDTVVNSDGKTYRPFRRWGRVMPDDLLLRLARDIEAGATGHRLRALLLLFADKPFPLAPEILIPVTENENPRIAADSVRALKHTVHPDVRAQGLRLIDAGRTDDGIDLLINNPQSGDAALFAALLENLSNDDEIHHVGFSLRDYYETNPATDLLPVLCLLYEKGPCSMCRASVVDLLIKADALPSAFRAEGIFDADFGTREMAE